MVGDEPVGQGKGIFEGIDERVASAARRGCLIACAAALCVRHMHVSRAYCRRGVVQPGGRHLAGSAQLGKGIRALMLHAPRARRSSRLGTV